MTTPIYQAGPEKRRKQPYYDDQPISEIDEDDVQQNIPVEDPTGFLV